MMSRSEIVGVGQLPLGSLPASGCLESGIDVAPLRDIGWEEGKIVVLGTSPLGTEQGPRHATLVVMDPTGFQEAQFTTGPGKFAALQSIIQGGEIIVQGGHALPIFPNGDVLMGIVKRQSTHVLPPRIRELRFTSGRPSISLLPNLQLEVVGGLIEQADETVSAGILRELGEEIKLQISPDTTFTVFHRVDPIALAIAEMALWITTMVIFLPEIAFKDYSESDGGISAIRLTSQELSDVYEGGAITAASALLSLQFLDDVADDERICRMINTGTVKCLERKFTQSLWTD